MARPLYAVLLLGILPWAQAVGAAPAAAEPAISVEMVPAATYVACDRVGPYAGLAADYPRLLAYLRAAGLLTSGPAEALYLDDPQSVRPDRLRSSACFPVAAPLPEAPPAPAEGVALRALPARLVARTLHVGPYADVRPTYDRLQRALPSLGLHYAGTMREVYLNDPATTAPGDLRTEICLVVEPTAKTDVGLYVGPGADAAGLRSISQALFAAGITFRPLAAESLRAGGLAKFCRAVLVGGGWAPASRDALGADGARELRAFVRAGGGYLGVCAGAYLVSRSVVWEGETLAYPIGLFEGVATGPISRLAPWPKEVLAALELPNATHPIVTGLAGTRQVLYQGGAAFTPERDDVSVLARYATGGGAALVAFTAGKGRVVLSSAHLEGRAGESAAPAVPVAGPEGPDPESDRDLFARAVRWTLGK